MAIELRPLETDRLNSFIVPTPDWRHTLPLFFWLVLVSGFSRVNQQDVITERRRRRRLGLEVEVLVRTDNALLPGRTQEISEAGMSAVLPVELQEGDKVELEIKFPKIIATTHAIVRDRNVFRHGFEFLKPLHGKSRHQIGANDCEVCGATGFILRALDVDGEHGVAFASSTCMVCGGTGRISE
jgi:hypothetical protein